MRMKINALALTISMSLSALSQALPLASATELLKAVGAIPSAASLDQRRAFVQNLGQWDAQAEFLARSNGANLWITDKGAVYDFFKVERGPSEVEKALRGGPQFELPNPGSIVGHVVRMEFVDGTRSSVAGHARLQGDNNYFVGDDESRWTAHVPRFAEARSERIYPGISARWYFDAGSPRYDLVVEPGADTGRIAMKFEGADSVTTDGQKLVLHTSLGPVEHRGLYAYQRIGNETHQVGCTLSVEGSVVRFHVGDHDSSRPLVIDPIIWSTFLGGSGVGDEAHAIVLDASGNPIVVGKTNSANFPTKVGSYRTVAQGAYDVFVTKLAANGATQIYSSYLGGSGDEDAVSVKLDLIGRPVIGGTTASPNFPTTVGSWDRIRDGASDCFVAKLSADGAGFQMGTFYGGNGSDSMAALCVDAGGNIIVSGKTDSTTFPTTVGAYDTTPNGAEDGFVGKFPATLASLTYSTLFGGPSTDYATAMTLNAAGQPIIAGWTQSTSFPTTAGAYDTTHNGDYDTFVLRLINGTTLSFSTLVGASSGDYARSVCLDSSANILIAGNTFSGDYPITSGTFDQVMFTGVAWSEGIITKLSPNGNSMLWSTFLGGDLTDWINWIGTDAAGNCVVAGVSDSGPQGFPFIETPSGQFFKLNAFLVKFTAVADSLVTGMLMCHGPDFLEDAFMAAAIDSSGNAIAVGTSASPSFPTTSGAFDLSHNGGNDGVITKLNLNPPAAANDTYSTPAGTLLTVSPAGVLSNDTPYPYTYAELLTSPSHATSFSLNADGSFLYDPVVGFSGSDSFTYNLKTNAYRNYSSTGTVTITVTSAPNAKFVSQSAPAVVLTGATFTASVTMKNTGTETWSEANQYRMISQNPNDNKTWGFSRMFIGGATTVAPGSNYTFTRSFVAPTTPGTYNFQWRMRKEVGGNFGETSANLSLVVTNTLRDARPEFAMVPAFVGPGATFSASVTMRNMGTETWSEATQHRMMSQNPADNKVFGYSRMFIGGTTQVPTNETYTFTRNFVAPTAPGTYNFQWRMHREGSGNFGSASQNYEIVVPSALRDAQFVSMSYPYHVNVGQSFTASVTMRNTGQQTWSEANLFRLMSQSPTDNKVFGYSRMFINGGASIPTGSTYTFTRTFIAPTTPGFYPFNWRMQKEGAGQFGESAVGPTMIQVH